MARLGSLALAVAVAVLLVPATAGARLFTVSTAADAPAAGSVNDGTCSAMGGGCTLRAAVQEANGTTGADEIALPARDYVLTGSAELEVTSSVAVTGEGARTTTVDAGGDSIVWSIKGGIVTLAAMEITGGHGQLGVGGVYIEGTSTELTLDRVSLHGNTANGAGGARGGGINLFEGKLTVTNSAIYDNKAAASGSDQGVGGALYMNGTATSAVIENSTIANNAATSGSGNTFGGGISSGNVPITLRHVTMTGNVAAPGGQGGNIYANAPPDVVLEDSIVAGGAALSGANCKGPTGVPIKQGVNLSDDASCGVPAASVGDPKLEPLGDHGGVGGSTRPPLLDSPARDAAASCQAGGKDQRGQVAPVGPACDVGAAELGADLSASLSASASSVDAGESLAYVEVLRNNGLDAGEGSIEFTPPAGSTVTFVNSLAGSCAGTAPVVCSYGTLAAGQGVSATIVVTAPATGPMTAVARASGPVPDFDASNDTASVSTDVVPVVVPPVEDKVAPVLTSLSGKLSRTKGGRLGYTLSEDASLSVRLDRVVKGRRKGGRCVSAKRGKRCTRYVRVGVRKVAGSAGAHTARLGALWSGKRPRKGRHRLTIVATDAAGNKVKAKTLTVQVSR
jgi:CSLREA domain-containing protein